MCYKEKNKYTYLSMCSHCNAISKYTSVVKNHLFKQHKTLPESLVIPIRIENKFERKIKKTLDRATDKKRIVVKKCPPIVAVKNNGSSKVKTRIVDKKRGVNEREISRYNKNAIKCALCNDVFNDCLRYVFHLVHTHRDHNVKVSFKCLYCRHNVQYYKDMQDHFEKKHDGKRSLISLIDCLNVDISSEECPSAQKQCPYCELKFDEVHTLYGHVEKSHEDRIECVSISGEITKASENHSQHGSDLLMVFRCPSCSKSFHTLKDILEHIKVKHTPDIVYCKPTRKRKPPKWMENDFEETIVKKTKNVNSGKNSTCSVLSTDKLRKSVKEAVVRKCEICSYVAKTNKAFNRHMKSNHSKVKIKLQATKKDKELKEYSGTEDEQINCQESFSKESHTLVDDKVTDKVETEYFGAKGGSGGDNGETEPHFNDKNSESFGDSDDDYEPSNSGSDSEDFVEKYDAPFNCVNCKNSFTTKQSLHKHTKLMHSALADTDAKEMFMKLKTRSGAVKRTVKEEDKEREDSDKYIARYKCPFCELKLNHYEYMRIHISQCHPEVTNFKLNTKELVNVCLINEDDCETFKCPNSMCDVAYKRKHLLKEHMATCTKAKLGKEEIKCTLPRSWIGKLEKFVKLICPCCQLVISGKVHFEEHLLQHYPNKVCEVELNNTLPSQVDKERDKWPELECTMCPYCDVVTTKKIQLTKHIKRFHSNETGTDVVSCILVNKSSSKDEAKLTVKDKENVTSAKYESEMQARNVDTEEEKIGNITEYTMKIDKNSEASQNDMNNDSTESPLECIQDNNKLDLKCKEMYENVSIQSTIPCGMYICPLCDFKTGIKKEIKTHMNEHNSKNNEDVDSIYTIPDSWIRMDKDSSLPLKCQLCDHEDVNLTLCFRHVLNTHKDIIKESNSDPHISEALFEIVNAEIEGVRDRYEREKYRCSTCVPGHIFKSKRGLQLHLKTRHTDTDSIFVYETMYKMLDLISDSCK